MASVPKKTIAIIGATGNQGSSVAKTFLSLPAWNVRCVTRNPSSTKALSLQKLGASIVQADLSDISSLVSVFTGVHAIFLNTDFWATYRSALSTPSLASKASQLALEAEVSCGKNAVNAAAQIQGLERFIYSALPPAKKHSQGQIAAMHWDAKAAICDYIASNSSLAGKASYIYLGGYNTNAFLSPRLNDASGVYEFVLPMSRSTRMPIIDPRVSCGLFVRALIEDENPGTRLLAYDCDSYLSMEELTSLWSRVTGKEAKYVQVSREFMHEKLGVPEEILDGPEFIEKYGYASCVEGIIEPRELSREVKTKSFEQWLSERDSEENLG